MNCKDQGYDELRLLVESNFIGFSENDRRVMEEAMQDVYTAIENVKSIKHGVKGVDVSLFWTMNLKQQKIEIVQVYQEMLMALLSLVTFVSMEFTPRHLVSFSQLVVVCSELSVLLHEWFMRVLEYRQTDDSIQDQIVQMFFSKSEEAEELFWETRGALETPLKVRESNFDVISSLIVATVAKLCKDMTNTWSYNVLAMGSYGGSETNHDDDEDDRNLDAEDAYILRQRKKTERDRAQNSNIHAVLTRKIEKKVQTLEGCLILYDGAKSKHLSEYRNSYQIAANSLKQSANPPPDQEEPEASDNMQTTITSNPEFHALRQSFAQVTTAAAAAAVNSTISGAKMNTNINLMTAAGVTDNFDFVAPSKGKVMSHVPGSSSMDMKEFKEDEKVMFNGQWIPISQAQMEYRKGEWVVVGNRTKPVDYSTVESELADAIAHTDSMKGRKERIITSTGIKFNRDDYTNAQKVIQERNYRINTYYATIDTLKEIIDNALKTSMTQEELEKVKTFVMDKAEIARNAFIADSNDMNFREMKKDHDRKVTHEFDRYNNTMLYLLGDERGLQENYKNYAVNNNAAITFGPSIVLPNLETKNLDIGKFSQEDVSRFVSSRNAFQQTHFNPENIINMAEVLSSVSSIREEVSQRAAEETMLKKKLLSQQQQQNQKEAKMFNDRDVKAKEFQELMSKSHPPPPSTSQVFALVPPHVRYPLLESGKTNMYLKCSTVATKVLVPKQLWYTVAVFALMIKRFGTQWINKPSIVHACSFATFKKLNKLNI